MGTLRFAISLILGMALPYAIQRWDRRRLAPEQRAAAWNTATWGAAIYGLGPLSMIGWAWVTRQRWAAWRRRGGLGVALVKSVAVLAAGLAATVVIVVAITAVDFAIETLFGQTAA